MRSKTSLLIWASLTLSQAWAEPPLVRVSPPGVHHRLEAVALNGEKTWLGGSVTPVGAIGDACLTLLGPDGSTVWEKHFGASESGDTLRVIAPRRDGGAFLSGQVSCDLRECWDGEGPVQWGMGPFIARISETGELEQVINLQVEASPEALNEATEPSISIKCLALTPSGELLAGGSWIGKYGALLSANGGRDSRAILLRLSPDLEILQAIPLAAESLDLLSVSPDRVLGAGVGDSREGTEMGPALKRPLAWDLTTIPGTLRDPGQPDSRVGGAYPATPKELWRGEVKENTECLQLDGSHLLISDNENDATRSVDLASGKIESLPKGILAQAKWNNQTFATGYRTGDVGAKLSEFGEAIIWRDTVPVLRWGSTQGEHVPFIFAQGGHLTLAGSVDGDLPGSPPSPSTERWVWIRMRTLPDLEEAANMGVRPPGITRRELQSELADLTFLERPGYDHLAGLVEIAGRPAAVVTGERPGFDGWSLVRGGATPSGDQPASAAIVELASWGPEKPPFAPMEPQIFPRVSWPIVMCRDMAWLDQEHGTMLTRWSRLGQDGTLQAGRTLPRDKAVHCQVVLSDEAGQCLWLGIEWNEEGQRRMLLTAQSSSGELDWSKPYGEWVEFTDLDWIGAQRLPGGGLVGLGRADEQLFLQAFGQDGSLAWKVPLDTRHGHAVGLSQGQILVATSSNEEGNDLELQAYGYDGKPLWTRELGVQERVSVSKILAAAEQTVLVGGWQNGEQWRGFAGTCGKNGEGWHTREMEVNVSHGINDALWKDGELWVGGELTRDDETDVFWGRLK